MVVKFETWDRHLNTIQNIVSTSNSQKSIGWKKTASVVWEGYSTILSILVSFDLHYRNRGRRKQSDVVCKDRMYLLFGDKGEYRSPLSCHDPPLFQIKNLCVSVFYFHVSEEYKSQGLFRIWIEATPVLHGECACVLFVG